jgi:hypothetical protein
MTDPILIAIDKHRRARERHLGALGEAETICDDQGPACEAEISSWDELLATKPTTLAGLQAFLEYVGKWEAQDDGVYADAGDLLTAMRSAAESARHWLLRPAASLQLEARDEIILQQSNHQRHLGLSPAASRPTGFPVGPHLSQATRKHVELADQISEDDCAIAGHLMTPRLCRPLWRVTVSGEEKRGGPILATSIC